MNKKALSLFHYEGGDNNIQERRTKRKAKMLEYYKQRFRKNLSQLLEEEVSAVTTCEMLEWGSISTTLLLNTSWKSRRLEQKNQLRLKAFLEKKRQQSCNNTTESVKV